MNATGIIKIGNVKIDNPWILAPMAGVTDLPFRLLCREMGAGMTCMEMVSAKAIYFNNKNTKELLSIDEKEGPISLQLFGRDPDIMAEMAKKIEDRPFDILDINMGCPVPKVVNNGEGSALMKDPGLVYDIVSRVSSAIGKPVSVKIRRGFDDEHVNCVEIAKAAEEAGAQMIAVHGRTREQYYSGEADLECIADVKRNVSVPVIGNGDVRDHASFVRMMEYTGCDAVMIGRAARGNPWIFKELNAVHEGRVYEKPGIDETIEMIIRHAKMLTACKGEYIGAREMRKHAAWYLAGFPHSSKIRASLNETETVAELEELLAKLKNCRDL